MDLPQASPGKAPGLSSARTRAARRALLSHYDRARRELPWRGERDPYRVWVSEVMLQQTRVETVIPFYRRWLERFPDIATLADASVDDVLLAWEGLGYYRRARALHAGARMVRERHEGKLPRDPAALRALQGVGEYTAAAVASIAFGEKMGAVDGNVRRVLSRLHDEERPTPGRLRALAGAWVDPDRPGDWNEALMELGATLCTPRAPECARCPLSAWCQARAAGTQEARPARPVRREIQRRTYAVAVVLDEEGRGLLERRPEGGLLGGMWGFPDVEVGEGEDPGTIRRAARRAARGAGAEVARKPAVLVSPVAHRFTHLAATYVPVLLAAETAHGENLRWAPLMGPWPVAVPAAQQKIARAAHAALGVGP